MSQVLSIGITGQTCSGKSTLASALASHFGESNCVLLSMDSFYKQQPPEVVKSGIVNFDDPRAFDFDNFIETVRSLQNGYEVVIPVYDRQTSRIQGDKRLEPRPILIVEGLFILLAKPLRRHLNLSIFLETDPEICFSRRLRRDVHEYGLNPECVHQAYQRDIIPSYNNYIRPTKASADLILCGTSPLDELVADVKTRLAGADPFSI